MKISDLLNVAQLVWHQLSDSLDNRNRSMFSSDIKAQKTQIEDGEILVSCLAGEEGFGWRYS